MHRYVLYAPWQMNLHQKIENDLKSALKSGTKVKTGVLRFLISAIKNRQIEIQAKDEQYLSDVEVVAVIRRQTKQRKDSIAEYKKGRRADLAEKERAELEILVSYLPAGVNEKKVREVVKMKISELGIAGQPGFGKLMGAVMKELKGQVDGEAVKKIVEEELHGS